MGQDATIPERHRRPGDRAEVRRVLDETDEALRKSQDAIERTRRLLDRLRELKRENAPREDKP